MKPQTPADMIRDVDARNSAVRELAKIHDRFSELELVFQFSGSVFEAEGAHQYALMALRAYRAELDDPKCQP